MARYAPVALVAALLLATAAAFAYTERLKLTPSPILGTRVDKVFSPVCDCETDTATISFVLRRSDVLDVDIVQGDRVVRRLVAGRRVARGRVVVVWDGRDDAGRVVREGAYAPRVHLDEQRRTIRLPNPIRVDVTPPVAEIVAVRPLVVSPDGDRRSDLLTVRYRVDEPASAVLYVEGTRVVVKRGRRQDGALTWPGSRTARVPAGGYAVTVAARDAAGNLGEQSAARTVTVRYVSLARSRVVVRPGGPLRVRVSTDAAQVRWKLGARTGRAGPGVLRLRAPTTPGRYTLTVRANGFVARAAVLVRRVGS